MHIAIINFGELPPLRPSDGTEQKHHEQQDDTHGDSLDGLEARADVAHKKRKNEATRIRPTQTYTSNSRNVMPYEFDKHSDAGRELMKESA